MGQNQYADWFINGMLGWIRWIAGNIAGMFQTSNANSSSGSSMISWFSDNWIKLLLFLIIFGLLADWIVWMVRWRPYWLWFHKKRILLDDDIDLILSDEELMRRYAPTEYDQMQSGRHPHFKGSNLGKQSGEDLLDELYSEDDYDEEYDMPDIEDPYLGEDPMEAHYLHEDAPETDIDEDDDYIPEPRQRKDRRHPMASNESDEDYEKELHRFDDLYLDGYNNDYNDGPYGEDDEDDQNSGDEDDDEPDISFIEGDEKRKPARPPEERPKKRGWLSGRLGKRKSATTEKDPFDVNDVTFDESDDDDNFNSMVAGVSNAPIHYSFSDEQDTPVYGTPKVMAAKKPTKDLEASDELTPQLRKDEDWRSYSASVSASVSPRPSSTSNPDELNPNSRRARRQRREQIDD